MRIYTETSLENFGAWCGGRNTLELETVLEELYPNGLSETELNDILWFDPE